MSSGGIAHARAFIPSLTEAVERGASAGSAKSQLGWVIPPDLAFNIAILSHERLLVVSVASPEGELRQRPRTIASDS